MSGSWRQQQERGSGFLLRFAAALCIRAGWPLGRALLIPICAYFLVFSPVSRRASRDYLSRILGRRAGLRDVYRHYHTFAATILDRLFFVTSRFQDYDIAVHGLDVIDAQIEAKEGCILLGAHLGSFEVLQTVGVLREGLPIKALMYPSNSQRMNDLRAALNPGLAAGTIELGSPAAMLEVKEHLERGGMVGMLGDRITHGDKLVQIEFLGRPARLPEGPLLLASLLKVPVILMFGLYRGPRRYEIHFEKLADSVGLDRATRHRDVAVWVGGYAARLEHYCRLAPYNWFNFFDFWDSENAAP